MRTLICTLGEVNKPRSGIGDKPESEKEEREVGSKQKRGNAGK